MCVHVGFQVASEPRDFEGFMRVTPLSAEGLRDEAVGSMLGLPQVRGALYTHAHSFRLVSGFLSLQPQLCAVYTGALVLDHSFTVNVARNSLR